MGYTPWGRKALDMTDTFTFIVVYNVVPISVVQQSDSLIHIRHSFFFLAVTCVMVVVGGVLVPQPGMEPTAPARIKGAKCPFDLQFLTWDFS